MMDDLVAWRIYDYQTAHGNPAYPKPRSRRPPEVSRIWHNSFHEQVGKNAGPIEEMLAARARLYSLVGAAPARALAEQCTELAYSTAEAVKLSRRIGAKQLGIPLNSEYDGRLMFVTDPPEAIRVGTMALTVLGPFAEDLQNLREQWNAWLRSAKGRAQIEGIRRRSEREEDLLGMSELRRLLQPLLAQAEALGNRKKVTLPNLASLMVLAEEDGRRVLLTGDGHWKDILTGLDTCGKLDTSGRIHVDVLKVQHHGSEHNTNLEFCRRVTADHYVFCANGAHENPDLRVLEALLDSRIGPAERRSSSPEVSRRFKFWFNSSSQVAKPENHEHMVQVERLVRRAQARSNGQMRNSFLKRSSFSLQL
jgi:hypothetical protein